MADIEDLPIVTRSNTMRTEGGLVWELVAGGIEDAAAWEGRESSGTFVPSWHLYSVLVMDVSFGRRQPVKHEWSYIYLQHDSGRKEATCNFGKA